MSISEAIRAWFLEPVLEQLRKGEKQMAKLDEITAAIKTAQVQLGTDLNAAIADLKAQIAAKQEPTAEQLQALQDVADSLTGMDTDVKAADPGPQIAA